ncbi:MAG: hypothetical protein JXO22_03385 [Phycisphaerae bacterium]|nr:hypothetical protein [Phycisphaerae bacterium]
MSVSRLTLLGCVGVVVLWGCSAGIEGPAYREARIEAAAPDEVLEAAHVLLMREFPRATINRAARTITCEPAEFSTKRESGTARDLYGGKSRMRRTAAFSVVPVGGNSVARLRIEIERQDTGRRAAIQPGTGRLGDSPAYAPTDDDTAATESQKAVWTRVRRDTALEQQLLAELRGKLAPPVAAPGAEETLEQPAPAAEGRPE